MDPEKKLGIILIIIGLIIPLAALPFVSGFSREKGFYENIYNVRIDIRKDVKDNVPSQTPVNTEGTKTKPGNALSWLMPKRIQFRFLLIPAVVFVYIGIIKIDGSRRRRRNY